MKFYWRHSSGYSDETDKVGHCGRDILLHFVKANLDKPVEWFNQHFGRRERVRLLDDVWDKRRYFAKPEIALDNGDVVVVSNQFGLDGPGESWDKFTAQMAEHGYSIRIESH